MIHFPYDLGNGYTLREITTEEFLANYSTKHDEYMNPTVVADVTSHLSEQERRKIQERRAPYLSAWRLHWVVEHHGIVIGWTNAYQKDPETLYMLKTALDPAHRGKGLYSRMLQLVIEHARAEGFQLITSKHRVSNNAVIIPKLKAGFLITSMTVDERFGTVVYLTKYLHPQREARALNQTGAL